MLLVQTKYRVRFNLEAGEHCGWWLIDEIGGGQSWVNPKTHSLHLHNCKLAICKSTAKRIHQGKSSKRGCAWISCESVTILQSKQADFVLDVAFADDMGAETISFNPRITPHWLWNDQIADNITFDDIITLGKTVYVHP